jgi:drug/metabolite transporter (DMT)-like permease
LWSVAAVLYSRVGRYIAPRELNLIKGLLSLVFLGLGLFIAGQPLDTAGLPAIGWLLLSGVLGIGLGDTAYFEAIAGLGPRRALLVGMLAPPMAGLIALVFLDETLAWTAWLGIALTIAGVAWVVTERPAGNGGSREGLLRGVGFGVLAALAQAAGAVLSRAALTQSAISPLWSAVLRLGAGVAVLVIWIALIRQPLGRWYRPEIAGKVAGQLLPAVLLGTALGIWLSQVAFKYAPAGVAQTLLSTSPLFVLPLAAWTGDRVTLRAVLGVLIALAGIALLFIAG